MVVCLCSRVLAAHREGGCIGMHLPGCDAKKSGILFLHESHIPVLIRQGFPCERGNPMSHEEIQPEEEKQSKEGKKRKGKPRAHGTGSVFQRKDRKGK